MFFVVGDVGGELFLPEFDVGGRGGSPFATFMPVPEAAMYKNHGPVFGQDDVRFSGKRFDVFPEAVPRAMQHGADEYLGLGVGAPDARHIPASLFGGEMIHVGSL